MNDDEIHCSYNNNINIWIGFASERIVKPRICFLWFLSVSDYNGNVMN